MDRPASEFEFQPLTEEDLPMLCEWLGRPHLSDWTEGAITIEKVRQEYLPPDPGPDAARPFIASLDGCPLGYIQVYDASEGPDWWPDTPGRGVVGIDQFIAREDLLGRGLGTRMISEFVKRLFLDPSVTEIRVDPRPDNARAIRCYEKTGFRRAADIRTPDGDAVMMILPRPVRSGSA